MAEVRSVRPIVLIDDEEDEIFITSWRLKKAGIGNPIVVLTKPDDALTFFAHAATCERELPAVVLCDVKLTGVRGYELVATARRFKCLRAVPIWMLSNSSFPSDIAQAQAAGANGYMVKPLSVASVQSILNGDEPVPSLRCYTFLRVASPLVRAMNGGLEVAVDDVPVFRRIMRERGVVVAETDRQLRYVWIENPHPDFDPDSVVGKRDDELIDGNAAAEIMAVKRDVLARGKHVTHALRFRRSDGWRCYTLHSYPICSRDGAIVGVITLGVDSTFEQIPAETTAAHG